MNNTLISPGKVLPEQVLPSMPAARHKRLREYVTAAGILLAFSLACHLLALVKNAGYAVSGTDSALQMMYFVPFLQKTILSGHLFWSWSIGLGGDVLGGFSYYYTGSPFFWFSVLLRALHIGSWDLAGGLEWKLILSIIKQFLSMYLLYLLVRCEGRSLSAALTGAMCYGGCIWFFCYSLSFDFMTDAMLWLPLTIMALRFYRQTGRWLPAVLCGAGTVINSFYFGYISFIFYGFFVLIFLKPTGGSPREKAADCVRLLGRYFLMAAGSLGLSCILFLPSVFAFSGIDRFYNHSAVQKLFAASFYLRLPEQLFFITGTLGFPVIVLLAFALPFRKLSFAAKRKTVLAGILFVLFLIPGAYSFFNGFSYVIDRWLYLFIFAVAYALPDWLDENDRLRQAGGRFFAAVALLAAFSLYTVKDRGLSFRFPHAKQLTPLFIFIVSGLLLPVLALSLKKYVRRNRLVRALSAVIVVFVALTLAANANLYLAVRDPNMTKSRISETGRENPEEQRIFQSLTPKSGDFYRVVFRGSAAENSPLSYGYYGTSAYTSLIDGNLHKWLRQDCDILNQYVAPNRYQNFDDRLFLESLFGVKYVVTNKNDAYVPYGYRQKSATGRYTVYENPQSGGIGLWYTSVIRGKALNNMNSAQRDAAMLQAAGVEQPVGGIPVLQPENTVTDLAADFSNASGNNASIQNGVMVFQKDGELHIPLHNNHKEAGEILFTANIRPENRGKFQLTVNGKSTNKSAESYPYDYPTNRFTFRLDGNTQELCIRLTPGRYSFTGASVSFSSYTDYARWMAERHESRLENLYVSGGKIKGTIRCNQKGILALMVPYSSGWHASVDGKPCRITRISGILCGLVLPVGNHRIELHYITPGFLPGVIVTIFTALVIAGILLRKKHLAKQKGMASATRDNPTPEPDPVPSPVRPA